MKNKNKFVIILFVLVFILSISIPSYGYADSLTSSMVAGISYALMSDWGISFSGTGINSTFANDFMSNQIESYVNSRGGTLTSLFGSEVARITAGKLVVGQQLYNGIVDFVDWLSNTFDLENSDTALSEGKYKGQSLGPNMDTTITGVGAEARFYQYLDPYTYPGYSAMDILLDGNTISAGLRPGSSRLWSGQYSRIIYGNKLQIVADYRHVNTGVSGTLAYDVANLYSGDITDRILWNGNSFVLPVVLNPDKEWTGTIGGEDWPDTNIDELLGDIFQDVADNNLDVDGEITDVVVPPTPAPTPIPVDPDTPLSDVPWEGLNDLIGLTGAGINEQIQSQTQSITSAQEATTEAVESLTDTITSALDTPDSGELPDFKFDLRELFPFCIPFDIYRLLSSFDAEPQAPHVQIPIVIDSINFQYNLDLDFSAWNSVAQAMRTAELIVYAIGLAWATGKVIKW